VPSPLRLTTEIFFFFLQLNPCGHSLHAISLTRGWVWPTHCSNFPAYNISTRTVQKTPFLLLFPIVAVQTCLFAKPLLSNSFCMAAPFAAVA
jgi:hypothetical protein